MSTQQPISVLFVCLGNICRSPTAHGIFEKLVAERGLGDTILVDSCGTGSWHLGEPPDERAMAAAEKRGYDLSALRARRIQRADFDKFHYILPMDNSNLKNVRAMCPPGFSGEIALFLSYCDHVSVEEVPDPYFGGEQGFDDVIDLVESASRCLLDRIMHTALPAG